MKTVATTITKLFFAEKIGKTAVETPEGTAFVAGNHSANKSTKVNIVINEVGDKFIATKADGFIYHMSTTTMMGRNLTDVLEYLRNPLNEEILVDLTKKVEKHWNQ